MKIKPNYLERSIIPINDQSSIFISYILFDTSEDIIEQIISEINFDGKVEFLAFKSKGINNHEINVYKHSTDMLSIDINEKLLPDENNSSNWNPLLIPFSPKDFEGIFGLGGSRFAIQLDLKVPVNILLSQLFSFIVQRKVQESSGDFNIDDFFEFIFQQTRGLVRFDDEDRRAMEKKLANFVNHVISVSKTQKLILIDPVEGNWRKFQIKIKNTASLPERLIELQEELLKFIDNIRKQKKLEEFLK